MGFMTELSTQLFKVIVAAFLVYLSGLISITLGIGSEGISMIWLPSGIGLLAALLWKKPALIGFLIGITLIELLGWILPSFPKLQLYQEALPLSIAIALFSLIEVTFSAYWIDHQLPNFNFNSIRHILIFLGLTALGSMLNAILSITLLTFLHLTNEQVITSTLLTFWLGNWCGALLITPMGLALFQYKKDKQSSSGSGFPIIAIGLSLTLMASYMSYKIEKQARYEKFERAAQVIFDQLNYDINLSLRDIASLSALYYKVDISRDEFTHYATPIINRNPFIAKITWIPRVKASDKDFFEKKAIDDGISNFKIYDVDTDLKRIPAQQHNYYFPVFYIASLKDSILNYGFNVGSNAERMSAIKEAMSSGTPISTRPLKLLVNEDAVNIYSPVYASEVEEKPSLKNEKNIKGFIASSFSLDKILEKNASHISNNKIIVYILDVTNDKAPLPVLASKEGFSWDSDSLQKNRISLSQTIPIAGRKWQLVATPENEEIFVLPPIISFVVFVIGLGFTASIAAFMIIKRRNEYTLIKNEQRLSMQNQSLAALTTQYTANGNLAGSHEIDFKTLTELAARTLHVAQASVWLLEDNDTKLVLKNQFKQETQTHHYEGLLAQRHFPIYFANIMARRIIDANDAMADARTIELSINYLPEHDVGALLDIPIIAENQLVGVFCLEHKGGSRLWTTDEKTYAESLRNIISLCLESNARKQAQRQLEAANSELEEKVALRTQDLAVANKYLQNEVIDHQRAEEQLKIFRLFAENATQGLSIAKFDRSVIYLNPILQQLLHNNADTVSKDDFLAYFSAQSQALIQSQALPITHNHGNWSGELELTLHDNTPFPVFANLFSLNNEHNTPTYIAGILYDLSAQKEVEQQLLAAKNSAEAADRAKSMFIASMSHELRTPLNSIIGFTGVVLQGLSGTLNERQTDQLTRVMKSAKHLLNLITDVIDISKIEAGYTDVHLEEFELSIVLNDALTALQNQRVEKSLELIVNIDNTISITNDKKRTYQVLLNLISNAIKYTERGSITVTTQKGEENVTISVADTGIGIPVEAQAKLFTPFERIDSHLRIKTPGTGLGLYLTKKITEEFLSGNIDMSSTPNQGSVFTVTLPITNNISSHQESTYAA